MKIKWLDTQEYPFERNYFEVNNHQLHYIDEGAGPPLIYVHGTPSWSFDFRNVIKALSADYRCIAPDHMGFGLSDKPEHYNYSTKNHSATLEKFILEKNLDNITLVVHDFGAPIGLNFAIRHPERISKLVILNSWLWSSAADPDFMKMRSLLKSPIVHFLYRYFNFSPRFILPRSFGKRKLSSKTLKQFTKPFANKTQRNGAIAFAHSLADDQEWFEKLWINRSPISEKPALFIWGMKDPVIKPKYLDKYLTGFFNTQVLKLEDSGHFPQEEEPEVVAAAIRDFINRR